MIKLTSLAKLSALGLISGLAISVANASEVRSFSGEILSINGSIISVNDASNERPVWVKTPEPLSQEEIGKTATGECETMGDICIASTLVVGE